MEDFSLQLQQVTQAILADYRLGRDIDKMELFQKPEADVVVQLLEKLRRILFPGYFREKNYRMYHVEANLSLLTEDVLYNLSKQLSRIYEGQGEEPEAAMRHAQEVGLAFLREIPRVRAMLQTDLQAAFDGDPAAGSMAEILFAYPGMFAVFVYRLAHVLYTLEVPMLPRMMTEHAHSLTGIDIHPGATIGEYFFIDHGTGVVIGETTVIGNRVKLYQGVTLGALSTRGGQKLRGKRRHPTIADDVTIYAGASVLGGDTVIGQGSVIGSNVFITKSVPPCTTVTIKSQELHLRPAGDTCKKCQEEKFFG
ncbi:MAG TPA: serine acetyltransferase [Candidatus Faecousia excrementipullorum]|nr:serine acetyltransferase [Candidatus Faecousia excrementipullorum]